MPAKIVVVLGDSGHREPLQRGFRCQVVAVGTLLPTAAHLKALAEILSKPVPSYIEAQRPRCSYKGAAGLGRLGPSQQTKDLFAVQVALFNKRAGDNFDFRPMLFDARLRLGSHG